eukprot:scaffold3459_cov119-Isochrysis_galbana.AAC.4
MGMGIWGLGNDDDDDDGRRNDDGRERRGDVAPTPIRRGIVTSCENTSGRPQTTSLKPVFFPVSRLPLPPPSISFLHPPSVVQAA